MRQVEKAVLMQTLDHLWREHIVTLEHLRQVIGLRGYAQRDPLVEYKAEGFQLFEDMTKRLREAVTGQMMRIEVMQEPPRARAAGDDRAPFRSDDRGGRDGAGRRRRLSATSVMLGGAHGDGRGPTRRRSLDLGPRRAQRALPLRLRQESTSIVMGSSCKDLQDSAILFMTGRGGLRPARHRHPAKDG